MNFLISITFFARWQVNKFRGELRTLDGSLNRRDMGTSTGGGKVDEWV
jgi:hypothetical protein